ncbi:MAG TPA: DUF4255 domain-containing protein [Polyangiales bacterium]|nr:DUF4255 domain-containing protein [Polyangiales bacterium]
MSGPFAIAAVTAVLKDLLNNGLVDHDLSSVGNVAVTALPPDRISTNGAEEKSQLNLFMFQVASNAALRNNLLPSRANTGERLTNPPLALDLRYLVTAYCEKEFHAEVLLGYAMQLLHETPVLTRDMIRNTLSPALPPEVSLPPALVLLAGADLAEQSEMIKISPYDLNTEEMSRLWSAMQAKYRPTAAYQVSVVLIEGNHPGRSALPVLKRGPGDRGPLAQAGTVPRFPRIDSVSLPGQRTQAWLGDTVTLAGDFLAGETGAAADVGVTVRLNGRRLAMPLDVSVPAAARSAKSISFTLPNTPTQLFAGVFTLTVIVTPLANPHAATSTGEIPFLIAPKLGTPIGNVTRTAVDPTTQLGAATLVLSIQPEVLPEQRATLVLGGREATAAARSGAVTALQFNFEDLAAGEYWLRLRIDGAESQLIDRSDPADLKFDASQKVVIL